MKKILLACLLSLLLLSSLSAEESLGSFSGKEIHANDAAVTQLSLSFSSLLDIKVGFRTEEGTPRLDLDLNNDNGIATGNAELYWEILAPVLIDLELRLSGPLSIDGTTENALNWEVRVSDESGVKGTATPNVPFKLEAVNKIGELSTGERSLSISTEDYRFKPAGVYSADIIVAITIS